MNSEDKIRLYRKIYRLKKQNYRPVEISAALKLPLETVNKTIAQLSQSTQTGSEAKQNKQVTSKDEAYAIILDRPQYSIVDIGGTLSLKNLKHVRKKLDDAYKNSDLRPVAINLKEVHYIDSSGVGLITNFNRKMSDSKRRVIILDPSPTVDRLFKVLNIYDHIPVFGTEIALESKLKDFLTDPSDKVNRRGIISNL